MIRRPRHGLYQPECGWPGYRWGRGPDWATTAGGISTRVVEQLLARDEAVRALVHGEDSRSEGLRELGAEVIVGDLTNPVDVGAAMKSGKADGNRLRPAALGNRPYGLNLSLWLI
jgi:NAD(P)H-binding